VSLSQSISLMAGSVGGSSSLFATAVMGRTLYCTCGGSGEGVAHPYPIPGTSPVIASGPAVNGVAVLLENGDLWYSYSAGPGGGGFQPWALQGNLLGSPTNVVPHQSWGAIKSKFHN
jgi:hypothetical protein